MKAPMCRTYLNRPADIGPGNLVASQKFEKYKTGMTTNAIPANPAYKLH